MASSKSLPRKKFADKVEFSPRLYHNAYKYHALFTVSSLGLISSRKINTVKDINLLETQPELSLNYFYNTTPDRAKQEVKSDFLILSNYFNWKLKRRYNKKPGKDSKLLEIGHNVHVYSNSIPYLRSIRKKFTATEITERKILADSRGVLFFKTEPKFKFRVYLKYSTLLKDSVESFTDLLKSDTVTPSRSLAVRLSIYSDHGRQSLPYYPFVFPGHVAGSIYLHKKFFIDFMDEADMLFAKLKFDQHLGQIYELKKLPDLP